MKLLTSALMAMTLSLGCQSAHKSPMPSSETPVATATTESEEMRQPTALTADQQRFEDVLYKLDSECAGNDNGGSWRFVPSKFTEAKAMKKLKKGDNRCPARIHSRNTQDAMRLFNQFVAKDLDYRRCFTTTLTRHEQGEVMAAVNDPKNIAVLASMDSGKSGNSEACSFHHFHIYPANGRAFEIVRDETD